MTSKHRLTPAHFVVALFLSLPLVSSSACSNEPAALADGAAAGAPSKTIECGPGTREEDGVCLPDKVSVAGGAGAGGKASGPSSGSAGAGGMSGAGGEPLGRCGPGTMLVNGVCLVSGGAASGGMSAGGTNGAPDGTGGADAGGTDDGKGGAQPGSGTGGAQTGMGASGGSTSGLAGMTQAGGTTGCATGTGGNGGMAGSVVFGGGPPPFGMGGSNQGSGGWKPPDNTDPCAPTCDSATTDCDGDGWTVAQGDCCDQVGPCGQTPELQNPGAVEYKGDGVDNDCDGFFDETEKPCDYDLKSSPNDAAEYLKALDLCQFTQENVPIEKRRWGVLSADFTTADGYDYPNPSQRAIRSPKFGNSIYPLRGGSLVVMSTGVAADVDSTAADPPAWDLGKSFSNISTDFGTVAQFPGDWLAANNGLLPTGCAEGSEGDANDSVMLHIRLRAPTNAQSFSMQAMFMSAEFPEYICSTYNDLFLVLVKNESGEPLSPNPYDGNIAFFQTGTGENVKKFPVGINLAGDKTAQKLFSVCDPKAISCSESPVKVECALGIDGLKGTGYEKLEPGETSCTIGGGTDWLTVAGNVVPGGIVDIRIIVADVGDHDYDTTVVLDSFVWNATPGTPGTN